VAAEFVTSLAWATLLFLEPRMGGTPTGLEVFQFGTVLIVVAVIIAVASTLPSAAVAGTVPITLVLAANLFADAVRDGFDPRVRV